MWLINWEVDGHSGSTAIYGTKADAQAHWDKYFVHAGYTLISIEPFF